MPQEKYLGAFIEALATLLALALIFSCTREKKSAPGIWIYADIDSRTLMQMVKELSQVSVKRQEVIMRISKICL